VMPCGGSRFPEFQIAFRLLEPDFGSIHGSTPSSVYHGTGFEKGGRVGSDFAKRPPTAGLRLMDGLFFGFATGRRIG
jgi:hypothetical protein